MTFFSSAHTTIRSTIPALSSLLLILLSSVPLGITGLSSFIPFFEVMLLFYWGIYRPSLLPDWYVFLLGLIQDTLYGTPLGTTALSNIILRTIIVSQRRLLVKESFLMIWCSFIFFALTAAMLKWLILVIFYKELLMTNLALIQCLLSIAFYACIHALCNVVHRILPNSV